MAILQIQTSMFLAALLLSVDTHAQQVGPVAETIGCWRIEYTGTTRGRAGFDLCLGEDGKMSGMMWNWEEGLRNSGTYRVNDDIIMIFGGGDGWPTQTRLINAHLR
jgi:hypothetical protein